MVPENQLPSIEPSAPVSDAPPVMAGGIQPDATDPAPLDIDKRIQEAVSRATATTQSELSRIRQEAELYRQQYMQVAQQAGVLDPQQAAYMQGAQASQARLQAQVQAVKLLKDLGITDVEADTPEFHELMGANPLDGLSRIGKRMKAAYEKRMEEAVAKAREEAHAKWSQSPEAKVPGSGGTPGAFNPLKADMAEVEKRWASRNSR